MRHSNHPLRNRPPLPLITTQNLLPRQHIPLPHPKHLSQNLPQPNPILNPHIHPLSSRRTMHVRAVLTSGVRPNALLVPQRGVTRDPKGNASAMVIGAGNKVEVRPIQVSRTVGDSWLVESGLKPGDRVVVEGLQKIAPGAVVAPTEAVDTPARTPAPAAAAGAR